MRRWTDRIRVCFVVTPVRYEVGNFFPGLFLYSFQKPKHLFKKSVLLKLLEVLFMMSSRLHPPWYDSLLKTPLGKLRFLHTLFLEHEAQINKNNYRTMLIMSKQVSVPSISSILQEMKIGLKSDTCPCSRKTLKNYTIKNIYIICSIFKYIWIAVLSISWNQLKEGLQCPLQCPKKWTSNTL